MTREELEAQSAPIASFEAGQERAPKGPYSVLSLSVAWEDGRQRKFSIFDKNGHEKLTQAALMWWKGPENGAV